MASDFYRTTVAEALDALDTTARGLSEADAAARRNRYGANEIEEAKRASVAAVFFGQFKDLLVIILIIAAGISFVSGSTESTLVIVAVLILNAVLGTIQTIKAEQSLESLKAMSAPHAKVVRDGTVREIPAVDVVPGDVLVLEAGDMAVADGRVIESASLKVNESALTGESDGVEKSDGALEGDNVALGDQRDMVFSGSLVTYGRGRAVVTATGMSTEMGKIATLMNQTAQRKTPLQASLDDFSAKLAIAIMAVCVVVFLLSYLRSGMTLIDSLMFAVALAVAAIPEALASIVTITLAIGTQKMARQNAIIKDLKAVETLGCVAVICSDKTGTLTQNRMTVEKLYTYGSLIDAEDVDMGDFSQRMLVRIGIWASDATTDEAAGTSVGDPTEVALVAIGDSLGIDEADYRARHPRLSELAFDSERKLMSTLHDRRGRPTMFTKGALDVILDRTSSILTRQGIVDATEGMKQRILETNEHLSRQGLRVLAFAMKELDAARELTFEDEHDLVFVGLMAMMDPPREESAQAVADARTGGIRTIMITGDHKITASAIAARIGIMEEGDIALEGSEIEAMSNEELDEILPRVSVYARVSPEHKIRIVDAWQRRGNVVSMTGDGVNDAPALKKADIGVAMGVTGTEVSKDAASMILTDDNFATIVRAVVNGRSVYANIRNTILFLLSGNAAGILSVLFASLTGLPAPFAAVHLLFINLLTDSLPAIAISMEPARADLLEQKPRNPHEPILSKKLFLRVCVQGALIATATMAAFFIGSQTSLDCAMTMAFITLSLARLFHGFNCRDNDHSLAALGLGTNRYVLLAFAGGVALLGCVLFIPALHPFLLVEPLSFEQIGFVVALAFAPTLLIQTFKTVLDARSLRAR